MPRRFTARIRSQSAGAMSRKGSRRAVPALLMSTSMPPSASSAASTSLAPSVALLTSHARPPARPRCESMATAASTAPCSRPATNPLAPSSMKRSALASPMPLVPPLISTPLSRSPRIGRRPVAAHVRSPSSNNHAPSSCGLSFRPTGRQENAMARQAAGIAAAAVLTIVITTAAGNPGPPASASTTGASTSATGASTATAHAAGDRSLGRPGAPVPSGRLRITGNFRDGAAVAATGLSWRPGRLPAGDRLLSFEVGYSWQACGAKGCGPGADSTATPLAARRYIVGQADAGRRLRWSETATEGVQTAAKLFTVTVLRIRPSVTSRLTVAGYPRGRPPVSEVVHALPESRTGSTQEYFQVSPVHRSSADGPVSRKFRVDHQKGRALPKRGGVYTGMLRTRHHPARALAANPARAANPSFARLVLPP